MVRNPAIAAVMAALLPFSSYAAPKDPVRLAPSSKWNVHYADDSCRMGRSFGEGDQKVTLIADRYQPGDALRLSFVGRPVWTSRNEGTVELRFGPDEAAQEIEFFPALSSDRLPALMLRGNIRIAPRSQAELDDYAAAVEAKRFDFIWPDISPEREAAVTFIEVKGAVRKPFILETGSLGPPLAALRKCTDELLGHWGIDVAKHKSLSRRALPASDPRDWITTNDYPMDLAMSGRRAIVQLRLNIDASGTTTDCKIQQSTRPKEFDEAACKAILRRAKFQPALDAAGGAIASYWVGTVIFQL